MGVEECHSGHVYEYQKCSCVRGSLGEDPDFFVQDAVIDNRLLTQVDIGVLLLNVVANFCYLGDMLCGGGGCKLAIIIRCGFA